jgi:hypothetical protein
MPSEDEIRRQATERPTSPAMEQLLASIPKVEFDPQAKRQCPICGLELSPDGNCPRCLNLIP